MRIKINRASKILKSWVNVLANGTYEPLIKVWSGPKGTRRHLLLGVKAARCHHLLSDGERGEAIYRESLPATLEFFEQYPLWNLERCISIAVDMGIKYPTDRDGEAYVMSTDFLCREVCA